MSEDEEISKALMEACTQFNRNLHGLMHRHFGSDHRPAQFFVMSKIRKFGPADGSGLRVSDIASGLGVTASSVTQIVTDLETRGLVARTMDPLDRRVVRVSLTPEGSRLLDEARHPYIEKMGSLARHLGREKSKTLIGLLAEVDDFLLKENKD